MSPIVVHHLTCAHITRMRLGGLPLACHVLLLETPDAGLVLVDTGLGTADYADISSRLGRGFALAYAKPEVNPALAAVNQLPGLGFDPRDVRHIVQTHLDLDHVGGLSDFPWATVHVDPTELRFALRRKGVKARGRYRPKMWAHGPNWQPETAGGEPWFGLPAARALPGLPAEIVVIPLPGHTWGHCGVAVESTDGWLLHAGDAFFDPREVHGPRRVCAPSVRAFEAVVTTDRRQRVANQDRLRALIAEHPEIDVFSAHDPAPLRSVPVTGGATPVPPG